MNAYDKPLPKITPAMAPFWEHAKAEKFAIQHCRACGDRHFPPGPRCPGCLSPDQDWQPTSGRGTLESWVDMHKAYWGGYDGSLPYRVCLVRLEEGPLVISNLVDGGIEAKLGARLEAVFDKVTDDVTIPKFRIVA